MSVPRLVCPSFGSISQEFQLLELLARSTWVKYVIIERLSNLMAAQNDLLQTAKLEEVGRGQGITRGKIGSSLLGAVESGAGRFLPSVTPAAGPIARGVIGSMVSAIAEKGQ